MKKIAGAACLFITIGCGDNAGSQSEESAAAGEQVAAAPRLVACEAVPRDDVAQVVGGTVMQADPREIEDSSDPSRYMSMCTFSVEGGGTLKTATVMVKRSPEVSDPATALTRHVEGVRAETPTYSVEPVAEYGPGAGWNEELLTLTVFRPGWMVDVVMDRNSATPPRDAAKAVMTKVLERLP